MSAGTRSIASKASDTAPAKKLLPGESSRAAMNDFNLDLGILRDQTWDCQESVTTSPTKIFPRTGAAQARWSTGRMECTNVTATACNALQRFTPDRRGLGRALGTAG